jgi:hypothetical protein
VLESRALSLNRLGRVARRLGSDEALPQEAAGTEESRPHGLSAAYAGQLRLGLKSVKSPAGFPQLMLARSGPLPTRGDWAYEVKWDRFRGWERSRTAALRPGDFIPLAVFNFGAVESWRESPDP